MCSVKYFINICFNFLFNCLDITARIFSAMERISVNQDISSEIDSMVQNSFKGFDDFNDNKNIINKSSIKKAKILHNITTTTTSTTEFTDETSNEITAENTTESIDETNAEYSEITTINRLHFYYLSFGFLMCMAFMPAPLSALGIIYLRQNSSIIHK